MKVKTSKGKSVTADFTKKINPVIDGLRQINDENNIVFLFSVSKYATYADNVKAGTSLFNLDYIYNEKQLLNDPDLIDEYKEIAEAIKVINKYATKRAEAKSKAHYKKVNDKKNKKTETPKEENDSDV